MTADQRPAEPSSATAIADEQRRAQGRLADLSAEFEGIVSTAEASPPDDEHDIEGSSVGFERARVAALVAAERRHLDALDAAAGRVEAGTYGRCAVCGRLIPSERLEALPSKACCVNCAEG